ncbi:MAG: diguanylate cyclase [Gammaproteobacteria bacterium]|nr:diguanylate cyclase [Gammaproteobacteria bacterium]
MLAPAEKDRLIRIAAEQAYNAILVTDAGTNGQGPLVLYCNPAFCRMTGYSEEELLDQSPRMLQGPETDPAVIQSLREALVQGSYWEGRTVNYRKDGQAYVVNWNISPVRDDHGVVSHFVSVQQDVTEQERSARERDMLTQALNQAHDPILITDLDAKVVFVNNAFEELTGYSADEILGNTPKLLSSGKHSEEFYRHMWQTLRANQPFQARFINQRKNGSRYYVEQSIAPVLDSAGHCSHYISTSWNVDDLVEREKALHAMAMEDKLTGLLSRRAGDDQLQEAFHAWRSEQQPMSLIICDIDHFKAVNDRFGHPTGDRVIQHIAATLAKQLRSSDTAIRWGGEEFMIIAQTQLTEASQLAERLRAAIAELEDDEVGTVTMSFGVAEACSDSLQQLISRADKALYQAKRNGRDQVCCDRPAT